MSQLQAYSEELNALSKAFKPTKHSLALSYHFKMPKDEFYTKKGHISLRSQDLDNILKLITDCLCNKKYTTKKWLQQKLKGQRESRLYKFASKIDSLNNLLIDDKFITKIVAEKSANDAPQHSLLITIELLEISK